MIKYEIAQKCVNFFIKRETTFEIPAENEIKNGGDQNIIIYYKNVAKEAREIHKELKKLLEMN